MKNILGIEITRPTQKLIILRGIPGAGKSTKAKSLIGEGVIHSTDTLIESFGDYRDFFKKMNDAKENGDENAFKPLSKMHSLNLKNAIESMKNGVSPVLIDNTNIKMNEPKSYVVEALKMGYSEDNIIIVDIGSNGLKAEELAKRNTHGVPLDKIKSMIESHKGQGEMTVKKILESKDMYKESDVLYSCVLLDNASKNKIIEVVGKYIPEGWEVINHHMTINLGGLPKELKTEIDKEVDLTVFEVGLSDMAMAVKVDGYYTKNKIPHITVAINKNNGAKPVMSNDITKWMPVKKFIVKGKVTEIKKTK